MKYYGLVVLFVLLITGCTSNISDTKKAEHLIPGDAHLVCKINDLNDFLNGSATNPILSTLLQSHLNTIAPVLGQLNTTSPVYVALVKTKDSLVDHLIVTEYKTDVFKDSTVMTRLRVRDKAVTLPVDSTTYYAQATDRFILLSNADHLINASKETTPNDSFLKLHNTSSKDVPLSVFFNKEASNTSKLLLLPLPLDQRANNNTTLDVYYDEDGLIYNGITTGQDSLSTFMDSFEGTIPQSITVAAVVPAKTNVLTSITFNDYARFELNRNRLLSDSTQSSSTGFLDYTNEIALADNLLILHSLDPELVIESIDGLNEADMYRSIPIYKFPEPKYFKSKFLPFFESPDITHLARYNNFILMAASEETLTSAISDVLSNNTLENSLAFKSIGNYMSDEASLFIYKNAKALSEHFNLDLNGYKANAVGLTYENNYAHINGVLQKYETPAAINTVSEDLSVTFEHYILTAPQVVKNHITKGFDIVIQDAENRLHLISASGKILWTKKLQGPVLGAIEQIDMYKNGRLQLAFTTSKRVYVIDRNGNDVSPFPLKFNDPITQPLSVFDYDNTKNYRLLVTQGSALLMFDAKGKRINGFKYEGKAPDISSQPQHFRIGSRDYIVFKTGSRLQILNRQGKTRIPVTKRFNFSNNALYLYQNKFTTTDTLGRLLQINTKGQVTQQPLVDNPDHYLSTTSKTLVSLAENKLQIKSRHVDLEYGEYTPPNIFYLNDKIYISTTDLQAKKVYLFDSQAIMIPGFPVYGTSEAVLQNLDSKNGLELVTQGDDNTIIVYSIN
jgi:hypothetical protein